MVEAIYLVRHGETEWSSLGKHTSSTDLPLTLRGMSEVKKLAPLLKNIGFTSIYSSPLQRARQTAEILGFSYTIAEELTEWRYGQYEGRRTEEIQQEVPGWNVFDFPSPGGESIEEVERRATRFLQHLCGEKGRVLLVSSGHISRVLAALWLQQRGSFGKHLLLQTASLSILGFERESPTLSLWNSRP